MIKAHKATALVFGAERLHRLAAETAVLSAEEAVDRLMDAVSGRSRMQEDDRTGIVCDFLHGA